MQRLKATVAAVLMAACAPDTPAPDTRADTVRAPVVVDSADTPAPAPASQLTANGWEPLRIGMTRAEVVAAAGDDANPGAVGGPEPDACDEFRPARAPAGLLVMIERDTLTRISVSRNTEIATPDGLRVGDPAAVVLRTVGARAEIMPHKYEAAPARYITVWANAQDAKQRRGILYEIDGSDKVRAIRGGGPSIQYVEGCL